MNCSCNAFVPRCIVGVLYFVSTTVNPILYNVLSRKYRQAFTMTLCNACMDDATRQQLQRDGFGAFTVYYSATRASTNVPLPSTVTDDTPTVLKRRRMWGNAATAAAAAVVVVGRGHLISSGTGTTSSTSPRGSTSTGPALRHHDGVCADLELRRTRLLDRDGHSRHQLLGDRLAVPYRQTSAARDSSSLIDPEQSSTGLWPHESNH